MRTSSETLKEILEKFLTKVGEIERLPALQNEILKSGADRTEQSRQTADNSCCVMCVTQCFQAFEMDASVWQHIADNQRSLTKDSSYINFFPFNIIFLNMQFPQGTILKME